MFFCVPVCIHLLQCVRVHALLCVHVLLFVCVCTYVYACTTFTVCDNFPPGITFLFSACQGKLLFERKQKKSLNIFVLGGGVVRNRTVHLPWGGGGGGIRSEKSAFKKTIGMVVPW